MNSIVRNANLDDISALCSLEKKCFAADSFSRRVFYYLLNKANGRCWLAEQNDNIIGYSLVIFRCNSTVARLYSIAVLSERRGSGVASKLLQASEQSALQRQCHTMSLEVRADNNQAINFYLRHEYQIFGRHSHYYADKADAIRMKKVLKNR